MAVKWPKNPDPATAWMKLTYEFDQQHPWTYGDAPPEWADSDGQPPTKPERTSRRWSVAHDEFLRGELARRSGELRGVPKPPPNYRPTPSKTVCCGTCEMFFQGLCWGYGNVRVEPDHVCDSWAKDTGQ